MLMTPRVRSPFRPALMAAPVLTALLLASCTPPGSPPPGRTFNNPLVIQKADGSRVETCADPDILRGSAGDSQWYLYCTTDPHNTGDRDASGNLNFHLISMAKSSDLVNWNYVGDAFTARPTWVKADAGLWAPEVTALGGKYLLYYTASDTVAGGSAIGVATGPSPTGPWTDSGAPVVEPQPPPGGDPQARRWVFDPEIVTEPNGTHWIYYGSYFGGVSVRRLSADGLKTDPVTQREVAIDNRYEGAQVVQHGGMYYLMLSAADCCNGPLTGYSVFVGRSGSPTGPFLDRDGLSLLAPRVGGTPVLSMNGNRWVGPGHNVVFRDAAGRDWTAYHAIDRFDAYLDPERKLTKRPVLLDPLDWVDGWPTVRGGAWASDSSQPAPAAQPRETTAPPSPTMANDQPGTLLPAYSDEFGGTALDPRWTWVRPPAADTSGLEGGALRFETQAADLYQDSNSASVLTQAAPQGDYMVEVKLSVSLPEEGCCFNYVQGGLVIYGDDDRFVKLAVFSNWNTRQIEFAKEVPASEPGVARYGNTVLASPGPDTWLRIVRRAEGQGEMYTAYSSRDGLSWTRGGTWTHALGQARIGLVSMGGAGFTTRFDDVRVYDLNRP